MYGYLLRRLFQFAIVLVAGSVVVWAFVFALPGDPATVLGGPDASEQELAAIRDRLGLDRPVFEQYFVWLGNALVGDFGNSFYSADTVAATLAAHIPASAQLAVAAMGLTLLIAIPVGILVALRPNSVLGRLAKGYLTVGLAIPAFWLGLLLIILFAVQLRVLPAASEFVWFTEDPARAFANTVLPAVAIAAHASSIVARFLSHSLQDVLGRDFVRTARAKGVPERAVILRHALRNAALPTLTIVGIQLGGFLGGTVVVESVFNYPGLGRLLYTSIGERDYAVVQAGVLFVVATFLVLNLVVDLMYAYLDPRIRLA